MAKNIKGRKFVATAASAALVASAIVPVASAAGFSDQSKISDWAVSSVAHAVEKGYMKGVDANNFDPQGTVSKATVAQVIYNALGLKPVEEGKFSDVTKGEWYTDAVNALAAKGYVTGTDKGTFEPNKPVTLAEAAKMIVDALGLKGTADLSGFADANDVPTWANAAIQALVANKYITGGSVNGKLVLDPNSNLTRERLAKTFVAVAVDTIEAKPTIAAVTATSATTLTLTGTGLDKLKAEDIKVQGNTVSSVTSENGKTAVVKLSAALVPDQEYTLEVKNEYQEASFKFTFGFVVSKVDVVAGTFDDDTKGQRVKLNVNDAPADFESLRVAGYSVNFVAVDSTNNSAAIFADATTGLLNEAVTEGDYTVQVSVSKGSTVVVSEKQTIKVRNQELSASAVKGHVLTNLNATVAKQNSSTLVVGESATVDEITVTANGADFDVTDSTKFKVSSSNPAVVSVSGNTLSANTPGTATISVTYGDVKRDFTVTVANAARNLAKLTPAQSSVAIVGTSSKTASVSVSAVDQYGDLIANQAFKVELPTTGFVTGAATATTDTTGKVSITLTSAAAGSGSVVLKSNGGTTLGSFGVRVTQHDNVGSKRLEVVKYPADATYSVDNTLDLSADVNLEYALNLYNTEGLPNGSQDLSTYKVSYNASIITIGSDATLVGNQDKQVIGTTNLTINAKAVGSTTVAVYDATNLLVGTLTVTVTNTGYSINGVTFKSVPVIDYKNKAITADDVLDTVAVAAGKDRIVKGITLSKATAHQTRINAAGEIYIDANGNGTQDLATEATLATVKADVVTGSTITGVTPGPITDIFTGVTATASGDKGTVIFKVVANNGTTIISSTAVTVNVK